MKTALVVGTAICLASCAVQAETVLAFAKRTAGKTPDQVDPSTFGVKLDGRSELQPYGGIPSFDQATGTLTYSYKRDMAEFSTFSIDTSCRTVGSYTGQNGFGAVVKVLRQACDDVRVRGPDDKTPVGMTYRDVFGVKMHNIRPSAARQVEKFDALFQVETVRPSDGDFVTTKETFRQEPTFNDPTDVQMTRYTISAKLTRIDYALPGGKTPFTGADPHLDEYAE